MESGSPWAAEVLRGEKEQQEAGERPAPPMSVWRAPVSSAPGQAHL